MHLPSPFASFWTASWEPFVTFWPFGTLKSCMFDLCSLAIVPCNLGSKRVWYSSRIACDFAGQWALHVWIDETLKEPFVPFIYDSLYPYTSFLKTKKTMNAEQSRGLVKKRKKTEVKQKNRWLTFCSRNSEYSCRSNDRGIVTRSSTLSASASN